MLMLLPLLCAACANDSPKLMSYTASLPLGAAPQGSDSATAAAEAATHGPGRKTIADRVLTAIALERVTGLKPDPSRLTEAH